MVRDTKSGKFLPEDWLERFYSKIIQDEEGHWLWQGKLNHHGYGRFWFYGAWFQAHRFSYEVFIGPIPEGLTLDHICRIRHCVFPGDLEPLTMLDNLKRSPLTSINKTTCPKGHPYTREWKSGRTCGICSSERQQKSYREKVGRPVRKYTHGNGNLLKG